MNRRKTVFVTVILILTTIFAGTGCVTTDNNDEALPANDDMDMEIQDILPVTGSYSENDTLSTIYAIPGDMITVELEENPTTGYSWNISYSEGLELKNDSYIEANNAEGIVGASGAHQWTFEVIDSGEQNISAVYMRPWEEKTGNEDSFRLDLMVLEKEELIVSSGTVAYLELEGGFFGIVAVDDQHYDPINLADDFRIDGTEVEFVAYPRNDVMSFNMWGQIVELRSINKISE